MTKNIFVLGVTGIIGSGKSVFCKFLRKFFGFHYIDADSITHNLYLAGNDGYKRIKTYFGNGFIYKICVNRARLRKFILMHPEKLKILNKLIHPLVAREVNKKIVQIKHRSKGKNKIFICIEAINFEQKYLGKIVDQVVILNASDEIILKRLKNRNIPFGQLKKILKLQRMLK